MSLRDRGISEAHRIQPPGRVIPRKDDSDERDQIARYRMSDFISALEFGILSTSGIVFFFIFFNYISQDDFLTPVAFQNFIEIMTGISLIFIILGAVVIATNIKEIMLYEVMPGIISFIGWIFIMLIPSRVPLGLSTTEPWIGVDYALLIIGILLFLVSGFVYFLRRRYLLIWYSGMITVFLVGGHELFRWVSYTGSFGIFDRILAIVGLVYLILGFIFYVVKLVSILILRKNLEKLNMLIEDSHKLRSEGKYTEAIQKLRQSIKLYPWNHVAWNNLGNVYANQGVIKKARQAYWWALLIEPSYAFSYNNLGILAKQSGHIETARKYLEKAVKLRPDYQAARDNLDSLLSAR